MSNFKFEEILFDKKKFYDFLQKKFKIFETGILIHKNKKEDLIKEIINLKMNYPNMI